MSSPVYTAVYSGVPVYEMLCRSVAVMRRRDDSYLNATQILKVAGVDKGRRTKILEREVQVGEHEKVQGGYGKYQGTWIPFERGLEVARQYGVENLLRPLMEYVPGPDDEIETPKKKKPVPKPKVAAASASNVANGNDYDEIPRLGTRKNSDASLASGYGNFAQFQLQQAQAAHVPPQHRPPANNTERYRAILMSVFLNHENHKIPDLLLNQNPPADLDIDLVIDDQGHTSLHWAAALSRLNILQLLLNLGADPRRVNFNGESALIRAVLVTNNFDGDSFHSLLALLLNSIDIIDKKGRSVIHHIALTAGIKGRVQASKYYLEVLLSTMKKNNLDVGALIEKQDKNGDTALNIACRIGNYALVEQLLREGASIEIPNRAGLRPVDFGVEDLKLKQLFDAQKQGILPQVSPSDDKPVDPSTIPAFGLNAQHSSAYNRYSHSARGREMAGEFEGVVSHLEAEISRKDAQLQEAIIQIRNVAQELSTSRKIIQQLSFRVAELESGLQNNASQMSIVFDSEQTAEHQQQNRNESAKLEEEMEVRAEIAKLKAIIQAHGISTEDEAHGITTLADGTTTGEGWETKAQQLIAKVLDVSVPELRGPGSIIDPLLKAISSESQVANLDQDISNILQGSCASMADDSMQDIQQV